MNLLLLTFVVTPKFSQDNKRCLPKKLIEGSLLHLTLSVYRISSLSVCSLTHYFSLVLLPFALSLFVSFCSFPLCLSFSLPPSFPIFYNFPESHILVGSFLAQFLTSEFPQGNVPSLKNLLKAPLLSVSRFFGCKKVVISI